MRRLCKRYWTRLKPSTRLLFSLTHDASKRKLHLNPHRPPATFVPSVFHFLDLWRVIAATLVLALHFQQRGFFPQEMPDLYRLAHLGVVIFFVISGYSVKHSAEQRGHQPGPFLIARLSRLYSVVVPTLLLALVLDLLGGVENVALYPTWQYSKWWLHLGFNLMFLGETWGFNLTPFSVIPYWSLAYEFWFYMLLAGTMLRPGAFRTFVVIGVLLIMGPRVWMLLPCWLLGVWAYSITHKAKQACREESAEDRRPGLNLPYPTVWISLLFVFALGLWYYSGVDAFLMAKADAHPASSQA